SRLRRGVLLALALAVAGCSPGSQELQAEPPPPAPEPAMLAAAPGPGKPAGDGAAVSRVVIEKDGRGDRGGRSQAVATFGTVFPAGAVRAAVAAQAGGKSLPTQVDVKRRHPDGSVRHAVVSVALPERGKRLELELVPAAAERTGGGLAPRQVLAGGWDSAVEVTEDGQVYRARLSDLLRGQDVERWLDGPLVTELRLAGPLIAAGMESTTGLSEGSVDGPPGGAVGEPAGEPVRAGEAHPALQGLFDIRLTGPGSARVSVVLENAFTDTPGDRTYDVRITRTAPGSKAPQTVFEQTGLTQYHHTRWRHLHHWGQPAAVHVRPDVATLIRAGAVPRYDPRRQVTGRSAENLIVKWEERKRGVLQPGLLQHRMGTPGGRWDIGLLPAWTAIALLSGEEDAFRLMLDSGDRAGIFSVHYRDRKTGRPLSIDDHPTVTTINPRYSRETDRLPACPKELCNSPFKPDHEHQPSLAYVPYLLTGDPFYLDEMEFWAAWNFVSLDLSYRGREKGLLKSQNQARAQAWMLRNLAHAAWIGPDADPDTAYFEAKLANNLDWYVAEAVPSNPLGQWGVTKFSIKDYPPEVGWHVRSWQIDFLTAVFDHMVDLGYQKAKPTRDWLAGNVVGRFDHLPKGRRTGADPDMVWATAYDLAGGDKQGNWYTDWDKIYALSPQPKPKTWSPKNPQHYQAIARAALAAAVRADLPGARAWYDRLDKELEVHADRYDADPTWAIVP
ncbi:MAG TPA: hypothetical protein VEG34_14395, partial [Thermoanaerobaculia bacterium]|nr:hypothetical protein [Thermoanaerobaculia bacterium]